MIKLDEFADRLVDRAQRAPTSVQSVLTTLRTVASACPADAPRLRYLADFIETKYDKPADFGDDGQLSFDLEGGQQ